MRRRRRAWRARYRRLILGPEFRRAVLGTQLDAGAATATASACIPNYFPVASYFTVQVWRARVGHVEHQRTISSSVFKVLHLACGLPELHDDRLLADLDHDLRRASLLRRADNAGYIGLGYLSGTARHDHIASLAISRRKGQPHDDEGLLAIGLDDQHVAPAKPAI